VLAKLAPPRIVRPLNGSVELYHDVLADAVLAWRTQHDAERRLEEQRAAAHARQRRLAIAVAVCLVALAAMTALTVYALSQRSDARANARKARGNARLAGAKRLDAIASGLIPVAKVQVDPELGLLLAARAARVSPDPPADDILRRALLMSYVRGVLPDRDVTSTAYASGPQRLAVASGNGTARVYGPDLKTPVALIHAGGPIVDVALSHDGRRLVTVVEKGPARLWQVATGRRIASLGRARTQVSFSPDDRSIITADRRDVRVFRASDGKRLTTISLPAHVEVATFTPRADRVVVAAGRVVRTFLPSGGAALVTVDHGATVKSVAVTPDEHTLVTAGHNHVVRVWALNEGGRPLPALRGHRTDVTSLALVPNRPVLISTGTGGSSRLWDLRTSQLLSELGGHTNRVTGAAFDRNGAHVLTWSKDGTARVWNVDDGKAIAVLPAGRAAVTSAAFGPHGYVLTTGPDGRVRLWRPQLTPRLKLLARAGSRAGAAAFARNGRRLVVATPSAVIVFDDRGRQLGRLNAARAQSVALSDNGSLYAYAVGSRVVVRRVADGRLRDAFTAPNAPRALAFSPGGGVLAVGTRMGAVLARRLRTGETTLLPSQDAAVTSLAFNPAGDRVAAGHSRGLLTVWRSSGGSALLSLRAHRPGTPVLGVAFDRSGRLLATAGQDADVHVWNVRSGRRVTDLTGQFAIVSGVAFSPDGRWIVSAGPGTAGLWDLAERQRLLFLDGHKGKLLAAAFDARGRRIETVGVDGTVRVYACGVCGRVPELLRIADARLAATGRRLTAGEARTLGIG
jgi:WD40 repeat protein